ncbi:YtxH domain-containing protein [Calidifontibacillus oryziterrae]|uniref:YtxH domain-containing protein n=1 Tax=Calidifontibacillus oryziterrae TaxID=1191699 RepID=UPI0002E94C04|nr:YtxH domain-containing protein [Calidifontibacillus oryziterrae]
MSNNQNQNQDQINSKDFLIGTLIGGIVGASIGLLLAPKSGKELRSNINEQALIAKEKGGQLAETAKNKTVDLIEKVKTVSSKVESAADETKEVVEGDDVEEAVEEVAVTELEETEESQDEVTENSNN